VWPRCIGTTRSITWTRRLVPSPSSGRQTRGSGTPPLPLLEPSRDMAALAGAGLEAATCLHDRASGEAATGGRRPWIAASAGQRPPRARSWLLATPRSLADWQQAPDARFWRHAGPVRSERRDLSPHESGAVDPSRRTPLLVHAAGGKRVYRADGPVARRVDDAAMREIGDKRDCLRRAVDTSLCYRAGLQGRRGCAAPFVQLRPRAMAASPT
jgi:hypothetical protein